MATLTQVAINTRKAIRYSIYFVIFLIIARFVFGVGVGVYHRVFPKAPPPPTVAFGKLPKITFPKNPELPALEYKIETVEGALPELVSQATVYFMPQSSANLLSLETAQNTASRLGFSGPGEQVSETVYKFRKDRAPSTLEINIVTGIFSVSYDLAQDPSPISSLPPAPEVAASQVRSFLSTANLLSKDLEGAVTHEFLKVEGGSLLTVVSLSEANLIRVNLFRQPYNELPSVTANTSRANVWFLVGGERSRDKQIVGGEYHYFPLDEEQAATYPLKTSTAAFEALKAGEGFIASLGQNGDGKVTIRKVFLAYFDAGIQEPYYQPVVVFEGDRNFFAYVPAVTAEYYGE
jgi:hypothetical protein